MSYSPTMARRYAVGDRVDGLYDGNSDDVWYPGVITAAHANANTDDANTDEANANNANVNETFDVLYDDGEAEHHVLPTFLRIHQHGTICVGSRIYGRYAGGDEWYAGKIHEVQDDGTFTIEYDDGEVERSVLMAYIRETLAGLDHGEEVAAQEEEEEEQASVAQPSPVGNPVATVGQEAEIGEEAEEVAAILSSVEEPEAAIQEDAQEEAAIAPSRREELTTFTSPEPNEEEEAQEVYDHRKKPFVSEAPSITSIAPVDSATHSVVVDDYATLLATIEHLETASDDAVTTKTLLSTLVKQMRAFPQATADLVHARSGEALLISILTQHHTHAVIQCYGFVLLRRLCFLCGKSTHYLLRHGIVVLVASAMRTFPEDAILQAAACGALAVFTRVHAGLAALLENRISHLVLATIIFHKAYSVHTRQVHYYACEVLLELCELGDTTTVEALCGDGTAISGPGLSDLSPVSLLLFLLRQALSMDDKKACCAAGTLLLCLASCHRHAAHMVLDLNGLNELSTVMATFPMEPGIQKYAASASQAIASCSMDAASPHRRVPQTGLGDGSCMEDLHSQRHPPPRRSRSKIVKSISSKRKAPSSQRSSGVRARDGFPSPARDHQVGGEARDTVSFSKYNSPIGKAPHLPPNIRSFGDTLPSPSAAAYHEEKHRNQVKSPLVILDNYGAMTSERKMRHVKDERTNLLFETYGVDAHKALLPPQSHASSNDYHVKTHGIKRRQLKTHIVSGSAVASGGEQISWASPVKSVLLPDTRPSFASKGSSSDTRMVRSSGADRSDTMGRETEEFSPASLRQQQQLQATAKSGKKTLSDNKTPRSATFQLRLENSRGRTSPIVLSPKSGRSGVGAGSVQAKTTTTNKSNVSKPARDATVGSNTSMESLNSYAAQLFKDEIEASLDSSSGANAATHERERLSFAEKLHKMIDKAKSSLAPSSSNSLVLEAHVSPVKTTQRAVPVHPISAKKKPTPPVTTLSTSRVAPTSIRSSSEAAASTVSTDPAVPKKPPIAAAVAKPTPIKKPMAASTSKPLAPPKSVKTSGPAATRPLPAASSAMKSTASMSTSKPAASSTKTASTSKPAATAKSSKTSENGFVLSAATATAAVVAVAAAVVTEATAETPHNALGMGQNDPPVSTPRDKKPTDQAVKSVDTLEDFSERVGSSRAPEEPVDSADETPASAEESTTSHAEPSSASEINAETVVDEAAAIVASVADALYADEYNDFDDLDNAPQTLDEEGVELGRDVSFEALMNLTAQVTEFTVATDSTVETEALQSDAPTELHSDVADDGANEEPIKAPAVVSTDVAVDAEADSSSPRDKESVEVKQVPSTPAVKTSAASSDPELYGEEPSVEREEFTPATERTGEDPSETVTLEADDSKGVTTDLPDAQEKDPEESEAVADSPEESFETEKAAESVMPASEEGDTMMERQDEGVPTPPNADRPESRQMEASYGDDDFDDAPENGGGDTDADAAIEETARDVEPSETTTFAAAEVPGESADDDKTKVNVELTPAEPEASEPERVEKPVVAPKVDDDYGDADFAGDESMPPDMEQEEAQGAASPAAQDHDEIASNGVPEEKENIAESADAMVATVAEDAMPSAISETAENTTEGATEKDNHVTAVDASADGAVESNGMAAGELVSSEEAPTTLPVDKPIAANDTHARGDQLDEAHTATAVSEPVDERVATPDVYGDAEFEADDTEAAEEEKTAVADPVVEEPHTEINMDDRHEPVGEDGHQEVQTPISSPIVADAERESSPANDADPDPSFDEQAPNVSFATTEEEAGDESIPQPAEEISSTPENVSAPTDAPVQSLIEAERTVEEPSVANENDQNVSARDGRPSDSEVVLGPIIEPVVAASDEKRVDSVDPIDASEDVADANTADDTVEGNAPSLSSTEVASSVDCGPDVPSLYTDNADQDACEEAEVQRPTTAMAYDDDDFPDETPQDVEVPVDSNILHEDPVPSAEAGVPAQVEIEKVVEPERVTEEEEVARPTTADAYADEAEFEFEAETEDFQSPPEHPASTENVTETIDIGTSVAPTEEALKLYELEQSVESTIKSPSENQAIQQSDADSGVSTVPEITADVSSMMDGSNEEAEDVAAAPETTASIEPPVLTGATSVTAEETEVEMRPPTPNESTAYDDDTMEDIGIETTAVPESLPASGLTNEETAEQVTKEDIGALGGAKEQPSPSAAAAAEDAVLDELTPVVAEAFSSEEGKETEAQTADVEIPEDRATDQALSANLSEMEVSVDGDESAPHEEASEAAATETDPASDKETSDSVNPPDVVSSDADVMETASSPAADESLLEQDTPKTAETPPPAEDRPALDSVDASTPESAPTERNVAYPEHEQPSTEEPVQAPMHKSTREQDSVKDDKQETEQSSIEVDEAYGGDDFDEVGDEASAPPMENEPTSQPADDGSFFDAETSAYEEEGTASSKDLNEMSGDAEETIAATAAGNSVVSDPDNVQAEATSTESHKENESPVEIGSTRDKEEGIAADKDAATVGGNPSLGEDAVGAASVEDQDTPPPAGADSAHDEVISGALVAAEAELRIGDEAASNLVADDASAPKALDPAEPPDETLAVEEPIESAADQGQEAVTKEISVDQAPELLSDAQQDAVAQFEPSTRSPSDDHEPVKSETDADEPKEDSVDSTDPLSALIDVSTQETTVPDQKVETTNDVEPTVLVATEGGSQNGEAEGQAESELEPLPIAVPADETEDLAGEVGPALSEPGDEYAFDDDAPSNDQPSESEKAAESEAAVEAAEDAELLKKNKDVEMDEETPQTQSLRTSTESATPSAPSPAADDVEYEDSDAEDTSPPTEAASPRVEAKMSKQSTEKEINEDEIAYADDDDAYNEFEDDDETPTLPATVKTSVAPTTLLDDGVDDAYDVDEAFDDDDDKTPSPPSKPLSAETSPPPPLSTPQPAEEEEADYDAEDDFED